MKKLLATCCWLLVTGYIFSQENVEMADGLRSSGKIYVVVGGLITILLGIILFLIMIDRKVSDIEKRINKK
ncbi:MAG: CcmD family protein [Bacteroidetes bacterium]|nr:MAG: CcmD family protein [Bacteroidota bacterium]